MDKRILPIAPLPNHAEAHGLGLGLGLGLADLQEKPQWIRPLSASVILKYE
jgi:hypothetical protein